VPPDEWEDIDFKRRLKDSSPAVFLIAEWYNKWRRTFMPVDDRVRPTKEESKKYADIADFLSYEDGEFIRNEVKGRSNNFTCAEDFPYPLLIVVSKASYDRKVELYGESKRFFEPSKDRTHVLVIDVERTRDKWTVKNIPDPVRGYGADCYMCPPNLATYLKLN
jgi:hypothetical protein